MSFESCIKLLGNHFTSKTSDDGSKICIVSHWIPILTLGYDMSVKIPSNNFIEFMAICNYDDYNDDDGYWNTENMNLFIYCALSFSQLRSLSALFFHEQLSSQWDKNIN